MARLDEESTMICDARTNLWRTLESADICDEIPCEQMTKGEHSFYSLGIRTFEKDFVSDFMGLADQLPGALDLFLTHGIKAYATLAELYGSMLLVVAIPEYGMAVSQGETGFDVYSYDVKASHGDQLVGLVNQFHSDDIMDLLIE